MIQGTLPQEWSVLQGLKLLSLSVNQITGMLPKSWSALQSMEALCAAPF